MKFSNSERTLHPDPNYTPPANYYNLSIQKNKILTGTLNGPSLAREDVSFGLSMRFKKKGQTNPGPGTYFPSNKREQQLKNAVKTGIVIREYKNQSYLGGEQNNPSIPYTQFHIDQQDLDYAKDLLIQQDLNKSALSTKKKNQGFTFPKSPRQFAKTEKVKQQEMPLGSIPQYNYKIQRDRQPKTHYREMIKKTNQRRAEIISKINPQFVPSLQLIELITKRRTKYIPGPGSYNNFKEQMRLTEPGISFSSSKRFSVDKQQDVGPGKYVFKEQNKKSISISKSARNLFNMKANTDLQHRFYIDPYSIIKNQEQSTIRSKNHQNAFGSNVARFSKLQKQLSTQSQLSYKEKKQSKLQKVVEMRLKKLNSEKMSTAASEGLLGIQSMISALQ